MVVTHTHHRLGRSVYVNQIMILMLLLTLVPAWFTGTSTTEAATLPASINNVAPTGATDTCLNESFNTVSELTNTGWSLQNLSAPVGSTGWYQGNLGTFSGYNSGYIAAGVTNTGSNGTISNWLISPATTLYNGMTISFWTRTRSSGTEYPDRLDLRLSTAGTSTDVGTSSTSVGDFTTLLLSINPDIIKNVYPKTWMRYSATISGLDTPISGRFAFRYFVTNAGTSTSNADYIGIDELNYGFCPEMSVAKSTVIDQLTPFSSTDFGDTANYNWEFGDGATGSGVTIQHTYTAIGSYPITLTVTFSGTTATVTTTIQVIPAAPGGIADDLSLWLKADTGITQAISDSTVMRWADQAGLGHDLAQSTSDHWPTYQENAWNSNPVLNFDTSDYFTRTIIGSELFGSNETSVLFAKQTISGGVWFKWETSTANRVGFEVSNSATRFDMPNDSTGRLNGVASIVDRPHLLAGVKSATNQQLYLDGSQDANQNQTLQLGTSGSSTLALGKQPDGSLNWNGAIGEVIVYKHALNALERNQVESYLALKYGLPLGSITTPVSYTNSQGSTIWNGDATYQNNVTGIGRDDQSDLDQRRSTSTLDGDILTVAHGPLTTTNAFPTNHSFVIWGHNGTAVTETMTDVSFFGTVYTRLGRSWRVQSSGTLNPITIAFDLSDLPVGSYDPAQLALMIDGDEHIADGQIITDGTIIDGQMVSFQVDEFPSEAFMSLILEGSSTLTVTTNGNGTVTSANGDINCGVNCSAEYATNISVVLTATPAINHSFGGWSGACTGTTLTCALSMDQARNVTATFISDSYELTVTTSGSGNGTVTSLPDINCGTLCSAMFDHGTVVTLTATPQTDSIFDGWSGACTGTSLTCNVTIEQAQTVDARFIANIQLDVTLEGAGVGTIVSNPAGINCGNMCSATFEQGTVVTLTATPAIGWAFDGWSGACSGTQSTCQVTLDQAQNVVAIFDSPAHVLTVNKLGTGNGTVTGSIDQSLIFTCGETCSSAVPQGSTVTLTVSPDAGSFFTGWSGMCSGSALTCDITINQARSVTATFSTEYKLFLPTLRRLSIVLR